MRLGQVPDPADGEAHPAMKVAGKCDRVDDCRACKTTRSSASQRVRGASRINDAAANRPRSDQRLASATERVRSPSLFEWR